ncbi:hypothetical protein ACHWQZ_G004062 [Mnemiopsis leidyi]
MIVLSDWISDQFTHHKRLLNFNNKSDDEFLLFLISTVNNLVQSIKPVFVNGNSPTNNSILPVCTGIENNGSPKKRLNAERFPSEQVNKMIDTATLTTFEEPDKENISANRPHQKKRNSTDNTYIVSKQPTGSVTPTKLQKPFSSPQIHDKILDTNLMLTPKKILDKNLVLTPNGKFFTDIRDEHDTDLPFSTEETTPFSPRVELELCNKEDSNNPDVQENETSERDKGKCCEEDEDTVSHTRRVTDCRDRRCKFCPSYDPVYASAFQELLDDTIDELEELELYTSATESTENLLGDKPPYLHEAVGPTTSFSPASRCDKLTHEEYKGSTYMTEDVENQTVCSWHDWSMMTATNETIPTSSPTIIVPDWIRDLSDKDLRALLISKGALVGAISHSTRIVYEQYLVKLESTPLSTHDNSLEGYPRELVSCLQGQPQVDWSEAEREMVQEFQTPVVGRRYRQGTMKCFFNYLLIDPRVADDLSIKAKTLNPREVFKLFIKSVFYVGKGKQSRPYAHLFEASLQNKDSEKLRRIRSIWGGDRGVVSLHVYNNSIAEEAFTREAVMIACIGLKKLANEKGGEFYGVSKRWSAQKRRGVGLSLLYKAHLTLLNEGHREIKQCDVVK